MGYRYDGIPIFLGFALILWLGVRSTKMTSLTVDDTKSLKIANLPNVSWHEP